MTFEDLVKAFGTRLNVTLEAVEGSVPFEADGMPVVFHHLPELDSVVVMGEVGEPPPENPGDLYRALLDANHLFEGTRGATLSRDPETGKIHLTRLAPLATLDAEGFYTLVEDFLNTLALWRQALSDYRPVEEPAEGAGDIGGFMRV